MFNKCFILLFFAASFFLSLDSTSANIAFETLFSDDFDDNEISSDWEFVRGSWNEADGVI